MFEVLIEAHFSAAHALRHYHGQTEPLHGHNYKVEVIIRGKRLQKKVEYLVDFVELRDALHRVVKPLDHVNLNDLKHFREMNPSAENVARYIAQALAKEWSDPYGRIYSVAVWETPEMGARYFVSKV